METCGDKNVFLTSVFARFAVRLCSPHLRTPQPAAQPQDPDHHGLDGGPRRLHGLQHPDGRLQQRRPAAAGRVEGQPVHGGHQPIGEKVRDDVSGSL